MENKKEKKLKANLSKCLFETLYLLWRDRPCGKKNQKTNAIIFFHKFEKKQNFYFLDFLKSQLRGDSVMLVEVIIV